MSKTSAILIGAFIFLLIVGGIGFVFFKGATWFVSGIDGNRPEVSTPVDNPHSTENDEVKSQDFSIKYLSDTLAQITLDMEVVFHWNLRRHQIIEDTLFSLIVGEYPKLRNRIVELISDTTKTDIRICMMRRDAVRGDFAFLLADRIVNFPYLDLFHVQWDTFEMGCIYPDGLLDYVGKHRIEIQQKIAEYRP